jgi:hypothetical protein
MSLQNEIKPFGLATSCNYFYQINTVKPKITSIVMTSHYDEALVYLTRLQ